MMNVRNHPAPFARVSGAMISIVALCAACGVARAVEKHWNTATGSWATAGNWSPQGLPAPADRAFVGSTVAAQNATVTLGGNATVAQLHITDGMNVRTSNSTLTVTGATSIAGQNQVGNNFYPSALAVQNGPAAIDAVLGTTSLTNDGQISISLGAELRCTDLFWINGGALLGSGTLSLTSNLATAMRVDGTLQPPFRLLACALRTLGGGLSLGG